jgi:predicted MFS family arabinose efflux permease
MADVTAVTKEDAAADPRASRRWFADDLWRNRDFARLWWAQTWSQMGSQVTVVAIPLIALITLNAGPQGMGVLQALGRLPFLLYLFAGVWVDRTRRRPVMIAADLGRGAILVAILATGVTHTLTLWMLGAAVLLSMLLTVWFDTAYMTVVPSLVERAHLMSANTRLETSRSAAQAIGPAVGGALVQALTAPVAVAVDALSFVASAALVRRIKTVEDPPAHETLTVRSVFGSLIEGLRYVFSHRLLRPLAIAIAVNNLAWAAELALYFIFLVRTAHLSPALIGLTLAAAGPGAVVGSMLAGRVRRWRGTASAIIGGLGVFAIGALLIPFAAGGVAVEVVMLMAAGFFMSAGGQVCAINVLTLRQSVTPDRLLGRANATFRFVALGMSPLGSLGGGLLGAAIGLRTALFVSIGAMFLAPLIVLFSPVREAGRVEAQ